MKAAAHVASRAPKEREVPLKLYAKADEQCYQGEVI